MSMIRSAGHLLDELRVKISPMRTFDMSIVDDGFVFVLEKVMETGLAP